MYLRRMAWRKHVGAEKNADSRIYMYVCEIRGTLLVGRILLSLRISERELFSSRHVSTWEKRERKLRGVSCQIFRILRS